MRLSTLVAIAGLTVGAVASPTYTHVVHERRGGPAPGRWGKSAKLDSTKLLPMRVALKQRNLERGAEFLFDVSHPRSENYGKHWTPKQIADMFAPAEETVDAVKGWLTESGIQEESISYSPGWLNFDVSVAEAERLLTTKYHVYRHAWSGQPHIACEDYSLPRHVSQHVDFITPTVHFDAKVQKPRQKKRQVYRRNHEGFIDDDPSMDRDPTAAVQDGIAKDVGKSKSISPKPGRVMAWNEATKGAVDLSACDEQIVPACLQALYGIPTNNTAVSSNSYGIVEYTPQSFVASDMDTFFLNFLPQAVGDRPIFDSIDGGALVQNETFDINGESDLDLQYAMALVWPQNVTLFQTGDVTQGASFNNFLDAIDASYCTYEGGDDPTQDGVYPDPATDGYKSEDCGRYQPTKVISTSYGSNEADLTPSYENRQCNEYMKLGLAGITILYSSGDDGVAGNGEECIDTASGQFNNGTSGMFNPSFPGTCPWVTSVGATQVKNQTNIATARASGTEPEMACETVIASGGGFSNVFSIPDYQQKAVSTYHDQVKVSYTAQQYNNTGTSRGHPDVSANGANYIIALDGSPQLIYGTSAAAPTFGSVITLINAARLEANKTSVGFLNYALYENPDVMNDITEGNNPGCGTNGFEAAKGWDPVTGLGTPNYPKMKALFMSLK